jgi:hypothetical protein
MIVSIAKLKKVTKYVIFDWQHVEIMNAWDQIIYSVAINMTCISTLNLNIWEMPQIGNFDTVIMPW